MFIINDENNQFPQNLNFFWGEVLSGVISGAGSLFGGEKAADATAAANAANAKLQTTFAQKGISWKVADAKSAGIHPLYALGANTISAQPSYVGASNNNIGHAADQMGQGLSRAMTSQQNAEVKKIQLESMQEELKNRKLDNLIKQQEYDSILRRSSGDQNPVNHPYVAPNNVSQSSTAPGAAVNLVKPDRVASPDRKNLDTESGSHPSVQFFKTKTGLRSGMSDRFKQSSEDSFIQEAPWYWDNIVQPWFSNNVSKPTMKEMRTNFPGATGMKFEGNEWRPTYGDNGSKARKKYLNSLANRRSSKYRPTKADFEKHVKHSDIPWWHRIIPFKD